MLEYNRIENVLRSQGFEINFDQIFNFGSEEYDKTTDEQRGKAYQVILNKGWTEKGIKLAMEVKFGNLFDKDMIDYVVETIKESAKLYPLSLKKEPVELIFKSSKKSEI